MAVTPKRKAARSNRAGRAKKPTAFAAGFSFFVIIDGQQALSYIYSD